MNPPVPNAAAVRPRLELLSPALVDRIVAEALDVLGSVGVFVEHEEALSLLADAGARVDRSTGKAWLGNDLVWNCLSAAPSSVYLFDLDGAPALQLEGMEVHFDPGSAALKILDAETGAARRPVTADLIAMARLTGSLPHLAAQSTSMVPADVPEILSDRYRLFLALEHCVKPIITGTFTVDGFSVMKELLCAARGGADRLRTKPLAIFDCCSSQPLKWSRLTTDALLQCARLGIPAELISVPMLGATAPMTIAGALVQHTAENLSGLVIHQSASPGSPVIYGGSPAALDLHHGTISMGAIETMMLVAGYAQIGRKLGLPTHGYMVLSDAKIVDAQAGLESGMGAILAALAGVNVVSGAGMLEFENCQSLEKLVIDHEACGMALRLVKGVAERGDRLAEELCGNLADGELFLTSTSTLRWMREEVRRPGPVIDRQPRDSWEVGGCKSAWDNARDQVRRLLAAPAVAAGDPELAVELRRIMLSDARRHGLDRLPV